MQHVHGIGPSSIFDSQKLLGDAIMFLLVLHTYPLAGITNYGLEKIEPMRLLLFSEQNKEIRVELVGLEKEADNTSQP